MLSVTPKTMLMVGVFLAVSLQVSESISCCSRLGPRGDCGEEEDCDSCAFSSDGQNIGCYDCPYPNGRCGNHEWVKANPLNPREKSCTFICVTNFCNHKDIGRPLDMTCPRIKRNKVTTTTKKPESESESSSSSSSEEAESAER